MLYVAIAVLFSLSMNTISGQLKSAVLSLMVDLSQYKIMLADSNTGSVLYQLAYTLWQAVGELFLPVFIDLITLLSIYLLGNLY